MANPVNRFPVNSFQVNGGLSYTAALDPERYTTVYQAPLVGKLQPAASSEVVVSIQVPVYKTKWSFADSEENVTVIQHPMVKLQPSISVMEKVTVLWDNDLIEQPATIAIEVADVIAPAITKKWGTLYIESDASVSVPYVRIRWGRFGVDELVRVWLRDWSDARERRTGVKIPEISTLFVSAVVKMWFYPIAPEAEVWTSGVVRKFYDVAPISQFATVYSELDIRQWAYYSCADSDVSVSGVIRHSVPKLPVNNIVTVRPFLNTITKNGSQVEEIAAMFPGETLVMYDGGVRLAPCENEREVGELGPCR